MYHPIAAVLPHQQDLVVRRALEEGLPFLHGMQKKDCYGYLAPDWHTMTIDEKVRWITAHAMARAEYFRDPDQAYITNTKMVELIGSSMRNRISENREQYKSEGFNIVSEIIKIKGKATHAWRMVKWSEIDERQPRMAI